MGQLQGLGNGLLAPVPHQQAPVHSKPATCFRGRPTLTGSFVLFPYSTSLVSSTLNGSVSSTVFEFSVSASHI